MPHSHIWDKLVRVKSAVNRWQKLQYSSFSIHLNECERDLGSLMTGPPPSNEVGLHSFGSRKRNLELELYNLRMIEDRCWCQTSRI